MMEFVINICSDCLKLKGESCNNPECFFIRWSMKELKHFFDRGSIPIKYLPTLKDMMYLTGMEREQKLKKEALK